MLIVSWDDANTREAELLFFVLAIVNVLVLVFFPSIVILIFFLLRVTQAKRKQNCCLTN